MSCMWLVRPSSPTSNGRELLIADGPHLCKLLVTVGMHLRKLLIDVGAHLCELLISALRMCTGCFPGVLGFLLDEKVQKEYLYLPSK